MIVSFKDEGTEDIFNGKSTKAARKTCPKSLWKITTWKLDQFDSMTTLNENELRIPPGNWLEALTGDRKGQHSIRINDQYRICFVWTDSDNHLAGSSTERYCLFFQRPTYSSKEATDNETIRWD
jgi:toxin HigB-1